MGNIVSQEKKSKISNKKTVSSAVKKAITTNTFAASGAYKISKSEGAGAAYKIIEDGYGGTVNWSHTTGEIPHRVSTQEISVDASIVKSNTKKRAESHFIQASPYTKLNSIENFELHTEEDNSNYQKSVVIKEELKNISKSLDADFEKYEYSHNNFMEKFNKRLKEIQSIKFEGAENELG